MQTFIKVHHIGKHMQEQIGLIIDTADAYGYNR